MEHENQIVFLVFFANVVCKLACLIRITDVDKYKIVVGKTFILKNLDHVEVISKIPVFKVNTKSVFRQSAIEETNSLGFSPDEVSDLKLININLYLSNPAPVVVQAPTIQGTELLSLLQFSNADHKNLGASQYVEVNYEIYLGYKKVFD